MPPLRLRSLIYVVSYWQSRGVRVLGYQRKAQYQWQAKADLLCTQFKSACVASSEQLSLDTHRIAEPMLSLSSPALRQREHHMRVQVCEEPHSSCECASMQLDADDEVTAGQDGPGKLSQPDGCNPCYRLLDSIIVLRAKSFRVLCEHCNVVEQTHQVFTSYLVTMSLTFAAGLSPKGLTTASSVHSSRHVVFPVKWKPAQATCASTCVTRQLQQLQQRVAVAEPSV